MIQNKNGCFMVYHGEEKEVHISTLEDGSAVTEIGAKAFLSCKTIEKLYLPEGLEEIGSWAFSHMKALQEIWLPAKKVRLGKQVFLGCDSLEEIHFYHSDIYEGTAFFLANMVRFFERESLLDFEKAGDSKGQWEWLAEYDESLMQYLKEADDAAFVPAFIGWFDVEDLDDQKERFRNQIRNRKFLLAMQRLRYAEKLQDKQKEFLVEYIRQHQKSMMSILCDEKNKVATEIANYKTLHEAGILLEKEAEYLLAHSQIENPEIKAFLLNIKMSGKKENDFFANFLL